MQLLFKTLFLLSSLGSILPGSLVIFDLSNMFDANVEFTFALKWHVVLSYFFVILFFKYSFLVINYARVIIGRTHIVGCHITIDYNIG
jgi:hypothetical protein